MTEPLPAHVLKQMTAIMTSEILSVFLRIYLELIKYVENVIFFRDLVQILLKRLLEFNQ